MFHGARVSAMFGAVAGVLLTASAASAQGWLADRRYSEGPGIRTGDLELHPGIGGEVGYDSNWFMRTHQSGAINGAPLLPPAGTAVFRVTPSFYVSTLGQQRLDPAGFGKAEPRAFAFRAGISATARAFLGSEMSQQHNVSLASDARFDINQGKPIGFAVFGGYSRLIQPQVLADPNLSFNRSDLRGGGELVGIPGGGALDLRAGYLANASLFEETSGVPYSSITHELSIKNRWRFRPRTAFFTDTTLRFISYPNAARALNFLNGSSPVRTRFGMSGLVTERFSTLLAIGYGASFFDQPENPSTAQFDSVIGQAEGTYHLTPGGTGSEEAGQTTPVLSTLTLGFLRDFQPSLLGTFFSSNKGYGRLEYWFGGRTMVRVEAYGDHVSFPPVYLNSDTGPVQATTKFANFRIGGSLFAEYRLSSSFGLNASVDYYQVFSDTKIPAGVSTPGTSAGFFDLNVRRLQVFTGVRYFF
jgi:hypothetical protein